MITRRSFIRNSVLAAGAAALCPETLAAGRQASAGRASRVVSVAGEGVLAGESYQPPVVHRMFDAGLRELTGERTLDNAWSSLFSRHDVVGVKINCIAAPRLSSSVASIDEVVAGLKRAGVTENNIIIWDHADAAFRRTGLAVNRTAKGVRIHGSAPQGAATVPWVEGFDKKVFLDLEDGTLERYRQLMNAGFTRDGSHREIFNSLTWLWMLVAQGHPKAQKHGAEIRRLYTAFDDREGVKRMAEEVANEFDDVTIEDEGRSYFSSIVTNDITKLVNLAVLKHNEDSGVTLCTKNIALGVTTNKIRFHLDFCARSISEIMSFPCIKEKLVLNIGEAAKISTEGAAGQRIAFDNRIFFSRDPVAMDRIGLQLLESKRKEQGLPPIAHEATHVAACARKGLGTGDLKRIDLRELKAN
jgi:hypothetical protein